MEGVPVQARERIEQIRRGLFTSDLSVNEFLLVRHAGFDPLGLVVGSSIYHIGIQIAGWKQSQEMAVLSQAMYGARELAMTWRRRPTSSAPTASSGCASTSAATSGGRTSPSSSPSGPRSATARVSCTGRRTAGRSRATSRARIFWTLLNTGYRPVGMVMGSCVYHVAHQGMLQAMKQAGRNVEMPNFTQALYEARELAMERMQKEAEELRAQGIVGVQLQEKSHGWGSHIIEFFAVGTAVIPSEGATRSRHRRRCSASTTGIPAAPGLGPERSQKSWLQPLRRPATPC
jgi:uncharacterized protein YbjQ (UPF0145 family)